MRYKWLNIRPQHWWMVWTWPYIWWLRWKLNTRKEHDKFYTRKNQWTMTEGVIE